METMARYILSVLKTSPVILMSWGACNFRQLEDDKGLSMIVNGYIYQGKVSIIYNQGNDSFDVLIGETEYNLIYVDMLVEFIDSVVEKNCSDKEYNKKVHISLKTIFF